MQVRRDPEAAGHVAGEAAVPVARAEITVDLGRGGAEAGAEPGAAERRRVLRDGGGRGGGEHGQRARHEETGGHERPS